MENTTNTRCDLFHWPLGSKAVRASSLLGAIAMHYAHLGLELGLGLGLGLVFRET